MQQWAGRIGIAFLALLLTSQFVPVDRRNPRVDASKTIFTTEKIPVPVQAAFTRSCQNCHSNLTVWPWYSYVAPVSWMIASDVHGARKKMNFSEWGGYPANKREEKLEEICEQLTNGDMRGFQVHAAASQGSCHSEGARCRLPMDGRFATILEAIQAIGEPRAVCSAELQLGCSVDLQVHARECEDTRGV